MGIENNRKQKKLWLGLCIMALALILLGTVAQGRGKLVLTYNPMPLNVPSIVMKNMGFLEEAAGELGLDVEYKEFLAGYLMTEAMAAGELDIAAVMGGTSSITSYSGGRDLQIFAAYGQAPAGFAVVTKADSPLEGVEALKGKVVGLPIGTETHLLLGKALQEAGLSLKDVQTVNMLVPDAVAALMAGQIDAACVVETVLSNLTGQGRIRVLRDGSGLMMGLTVSTTRKALLEEKPEALVAYLKAHARSLEFMQTEPEKTLELVAKETKLPPELAQSIMAKYVFEPAIGPDILDALEDTAQFLKEIGVISESIVIKDLVDTTIIEGL